MQKTIIILAILLGYLLSLSAQEGASINEDGTPADPSALLDVQSTTKGALLPRLNLTSTSSSSPISGTPAVGLLVFNLATANDVVPGFYFWNGTAWQAISSTSSGSAPHAIGDTLQGGIIFHKFPLGGGLIAAPTDQSAGTTWGCYGTNLAGADGTGVGTGEQNTQDIETGCTTANIAADLCANLNLGGKTDWYLPSKDELKKMWDNLADSDGDNSNTGPSDPYNLGGFANLRYWSSSEYDYGSSWNLDFSDGLDYGSYKGDTLYVRCIRRFL
jgi:hypothetical protein